MNNHHAPLIHLESCLTVHGSVAEHMVDKAHEVQHTWTCHVSPFKVLGTGQVTDRHFDKACACPMAVRRCHCNDDAPQNLMAPYTSACLVNTHLLLLSFMEHTELFVTQQAL